MGMCMKKSIYGLLFVALIFLTQLVFAQSRSPSGIRGFSCAGEGQVGYQNHEFSVTIHEAKIDFVKNCALFNFDVLVSDAASRQWEINHFLRAMDQKSNGQNWQLTYADQSWVGVIESRAPLSELCSSQVMQVQVTFMPSSLGAGQKPFFERFHLRCERH